MAFFDDSDVQIRDSQLSELLKHQQPINGKVGTRLLSDFSGVGTLSDLSNRDP